MNYVPLTFGLDGEIDAIKNQNYGTNVSPFLQVIKDIKKSGGKASILSDIEEAIISKPNNFFFVTIPKNYDLTKPLKNPVSAFYRHLATTPTYEYKVLNNFTKHANVIPVLEINFNSYIPGQLATLKSNIKSTSGSYAYRVNVDKLNIIQHELTSIVTSNDYIIYDLDEEYLFYKGKTRSEVTDLELLKKSKKCSLVVVKQIYNALTFNKMPNRKIIPSDDAFKCIDYDFYKDYKTSGFDHFGDWAGIRNNPMYDGGMSYPAYLVVELDTFEHHGFKGIEKDINSFESTLLPKYISSTHWNSILVSSYKATCNSCNYINNFITKSIKINSASKWKTMTLGHFYKATDYKINTGRI